MLALVEDKWLGTVLGKKVYTVARDIENLDIDAGNLGNCVQIVQEEAHPLDARNSEIWKMAAAVETYGFFAN